MFPNYSTPGLCSHLKFCCFSSILHLLCKDGPLAMPPQKTPIARPSYIHVANHSPSKTAALRFSLLLPSPGAPSMSLQTVRKDAIQLGHAKRENVSACENSRQSPNQESPQRTADGHPSIDSWNKFLVAVFLLMGTSLEPCAFLVAHAPRAVPWRAHPRDKESRGIGWLARAANS